MYNVKREIQSPCFKYEGTFSNTQNMNPAYNTNKIIIISAYIDTKVKQSNKNK